MSHGFSPLMIGAFRKKGRDAFGRVRDAKPPLLLPKVMEGCPIASSSPLLRLPPEVLGDIAHLIADDYATLAALSLVNSDCRQLARSCQFADICFDYGPRSSQLLIRLAEEALVRDGTKIAGRARTTLSIGPCIRRVKVHPHPDWVAHKHIEVYELWNRRADPVPWRQQEKMREQATESYLVTFREPLLLALRKAMPNLEALSWRDTVCLDRDSICVIANLPIRHLKLPRATFGEPFRLEPPLVPLALPLQSLTFGAGLCHHDSHKIQPTGGVTTSGGDRSMSSVIGTLLRRCSATLTRLIFEYTAFWAERTVISFGQEPVDFPRLMFLNLYNLRGNLDDMAWSSLLSAPLRHFTLPDALSRREFIRALSTCSTFRDLETLVVPNLSKPRDPKSHPGVFDFIVRHSHVRKLSVRYGEAGVVDSHLIPLLTNGTWSNLTSLSLSWNDWNVQHAEETTVTVPAASLAAIGSIVSLEQLRLSAGSSVGWRRQWLVDHEVMRSGLLGLLRLRRLALVRDTYVNPGSPVADNAHTYYEMRTPMRIHWDDASDGADEAALGRTELDPLEIWELAHRNRMVREAGKYAAVLPQLEWMYCGEWPMNVERRQTGEEISRVAVPWGEERDSCWTMLTREFSMGDE
jgi:hypothetical protein